MQAQLATRQVAKLEKGQGMCRIKGAPEHHLSAPTSGADSEVLGPKAKKGHHATVPRNPLPTSLCRNRDFQSNPRRIWYSQGYEVTLSRTYALFSSCTSRLYRFYIEVETASPDHVDCTE